jgi:hypothetical protein
LKVWEDARQPDVRVRFSGISLAAQLVFMDIRAIRSRSVFVAIERTTLSLIFVWTGDKLYKLIRTSRAAPTITGEGSPDPQPAPGTPGYFPAHAGPASETAAFHERATRSICAVGATHTCALGSDDIIRNADATSASVAARGNCSRFHLSGDIELETRTLTTRLRGQKG